MARTRNRVPKLSNKVERTTGRYYACYRDANGKHLRKRFTTDYETSQAEYTAWLETFYRDRSAQVHHELLTLAPGSWPAIMLDFLRVQRDRVRGNQEPKRAGSISIRSYADIERIHKNFLAWAKGQWGEDVVYQTPFARLMTQSAYEQMTSHLIHQGFGDAYVRRHKLQFWELARFAKHRPYEQRLDFDREDTRRYREFSHQRERWMPDKRLLCRILKPATIRERLWVWMGIGLGFGNQDIARCRPCNFDQETYDLRRGKTGLSRYGRMWPQVWSHLKEYLVEHPRPSDDLMFITRNGLPLVHERVKTKEELENGTRTHGPKPTPFVHVDSLFQAWKKLLDRADVRTEWKGGFYVLRSLGATIFAHRPGVGILDVRTFLGHGDSMMAEQYMQPLRPEIKPVIEWLTSVLDSPDLQAAFNSRLRKNRSRAQA